MKKNLKFKSKFDEIIRITPEGKKERMELC